MYSPVITKLDVSEYKFNMFGSLEVEFWLIYLVAVLNDPANVGQ